MIESFLEPSMHKNGATFLVLDENLISSKDGDEALLANGLGREEVVL